MLKTDLNKHVFVLKQNFFILNLIDNFNLSLIAGINSSISSVALKQDQLVNSQLPMSTFKNWHL